ncbi:MAG: hypothetical protein U1F57_05775 [bacterium]
MDDPLFGVVRLYLLSAKVFTQESTPAAATARRQLSSGCGVLRPRRHPLRPRRKNRSPILRKSNTGNASNVTDAGGTLVVAELAKDDPDFAKKKKAFDEYKAQADKEPLAP